MKTDKPIAITKVEITIGGKLISLTLEQAQELKGILNEAFPDAKPSPVTYPIFVDRYIYRDRYPHWNYPVYTGTGSTLSDTNRYQCSNTLSLCATQ